MRCCAGAGAPLAHRSWLTSWLAINNISRYPAGLQLASQLAGQLNIFSSASQLASRLWRIS